MTAARRAPVQLHPEPAAERLLTLDEAAARLGVSPSQVRRQTYDPDRPLEVVMVGKRSVRIREETLNRWIRDNVRRA